MNIAFANDRKSIKTHLKNSLFLVLAIATFAVAVFSSLPQSKVVSITSTVNNAYNTVATKAGIEEKNLNNNSLLGSTNAFGFCGQDTGYGMKSSNSWSSSFADISYPNLTNRRFTIQEAFGNSMRFVGYYGEGDGPMLVASKEENPPEFVKVEKERLESVRNLNSCLWNKIGLSIGNGFFSISNSIVGLMTNVTSAVFNPNFVCDIGTDPNDKNDPGNFCINLVPIIGGKTDSDSSIIKALGNSIYFPLLTIMSLVMAFYMMYQGIVKRQIRKAFGDMLWSFSTVILGILMILNPNLLATAPAQVASAGASCVMGAFSGQNCMTGGSFDELKINDGTAKNSGSKYVCQSKASGTSFNEKVQMNVSSMSCEIWKAFVLDPYSVASFGVNFEQLDTIASGSKGSAFVSEAKGVNPETFCVNLTSSQSASSMKNGRLNLDSSTNKVCNIAAYQLLLLTNAQSGDSRPPEGNSVDERWYNLVEVAGHNDDMWNNWTSTGSSTTNKTLFSGVSILASIGGAMVIFVTGFFALIYYISTILLMVFAPIFLLLGVSPGRGRKIMIGWFEKTISNILKYIVSAAFVVVSVALYGGVLSTTTGIGTTIVFVVVITVALMQYRKEFIEMLGKVNMGGQQLSNAAMDWAAQKSKKGYDTGRDLTKSGIGGAVGSKLAGGSATGGFSAGVKRNLKRGHGVIANTAREYDNVSRDNLNKLDRQVKDYERRQNNKNTAAALKSASNKVTVTKRSKLGNFANGAAIEAIGLNGQGLHSVLAGAGISHVANLNGKFRGSRAGELQHHMANGNMDINALRKNIASREDEVFNDARRAAKDMNLNINLADLKKGRVDLAELRQAEAKQYQQHMKVSDLMARKENGFDVSDEEINSAVEELGRRESIRIQKENEFNNNDDEIRNSLLQSDLKINAPSIQGELESNLAKLNTSIGNTEMTDVDKQMVSTYQDSKDGLDLATSLYKETVSNPNATREEKANAKESLDSAVADYNSAIENTGNNIHVQKEILQDDLQDVKNGNAYDVTVKYAGHSDANDAIGAAKIGDGIVAGNVNEELAPTESSNPDVYEEVVEYNNYDDNSSDIDESRDMNDVFYESAKDLVNSSYAGQGVSQRKIKKKHVKDYMNSRDEGLIEVDDELLIDKGPFKDYRKDRKAKKTIKKNHAKEQTKREMRGRGF